MSVSHYTFEGDASERLVLEYYEFLLRTRAVPHESNSFTSVQLQ